MKIFAATALGFALIGAPAFADSHATGDAEAGEKVYNKCKACHMIQDADGNDIVKGGRTGPNLYGIYMRVAGSEDFRYGDSLVEAGEAGLEWNEEAFVKYVADPKKFLAEYNDDKRAKSKMSFKLKNEEDATNLWAYLVSVGPEVEMEEKSDG
ncbi:c-type cytochrome [Sulfitobacter sp. F26169L]|uniref:c-type cytochrome n=1 Tax=Sulfitobacter sp. F26169L TaxID=2996015 RepID=UPI002260AE8A|nr:c-type cytochrome [Sulfitobacter sp. F26169L]MCX7566868.1 c-type cytochrome [Sulfitobacter sp. F26169L]